MSLRDIEKRTQACTACPLHQTRTQVVPGEGNPASGIMLVGEAPGRNEDLQGVPFVGAAGHLLDRLLERAGIHGRKQYYITNVIKCRPPGNRDPEPEEIEACESFLREQIEVIQPKVFVAIGRFAASQLAMTWASMGDLIQMDLAYTQLDGSGSIPVIPIYHPSYLLRQGQGKSPRAKALFEDTVARLAKARDLIQK